MLGCKPSTEAWTKEKWHKPAECTDVQLNFRAGWYPHAQPFSVGFGGDENKYTLYPMSRRINEIPDNETAFVVIHLFLHILPYHYSAFKNKMTIIRDSVKKLLTRNTKAKVFIKAPHTYVDSPSGKARMNDFFGYVFANIMYDLFSGLHDRVIYINHRDSTDALRIKWNHPDADVVRPLVDQMFSYGCDYTV